MDDSARSDPLKTRGALRNEVGVLVHMRVVILIVVVVHLVVWIDL
jgi:hypothetical protein